MNTVIISHTATLPGAWAHGIETLITVRDTGTVRIEVVGTHCASATVSEDGESLVWWAECDCWPWSQTAFAMAQAMILPAMSVVSQVGGPLFNSLTQQGKDACIRAHVGKMTIRHRRHSTREAQKRAFSVAR